MDMESDARMLGPEITGWGKAVPTNRLTNKDIVELVPDTSNEWIIKATGIEERGMAMPWESVVTLAIKAARGALLMADFDPEIVEEIVVATVSAGREFPSVANEVQADLGNHAGSFDLKAACSGFLYALDIGFSRAARGSVNNCLVIGAETLTRKVDWTDRSTAVLFGDAAGAFFIENTDTPAEVVVFVTHSDGAKADLLKETDEHVIYMASGRPIFENAIQAMSLRANEALEEAGKSIDDVDLFVPHQANIRIMRQVARKLGIPKNKVFANVDRHGNTSSASIPLAVCEAVEQGRLKPGDILLMAAFGGGFTSAAGVVQWTRGREEMGMRSRVGQKVREVIRR